MSLTYSQRAKRWNTNAFAAEWLVNGVEYCRTSEGKKEFDAWVMGKFGPVEGPKKIKLCQQPAPVKRRMYYLHKDIIHWNIVAADLGVSEQCLELYHHFSLGVDKCTPERVKPAPKRRRGESSAEWLARSQAAISEGCKYPNFDWDISRAIAISELGKVRDTMEMWRTRPDIFFEAIGRRGASIIPSQPIFAFKAPTILKESKEYQRVHTMDDAVRSLTYTQTLAHMTWSHATELFDDLAHMGLTTTSSVERAYRKDRKLLWRLVSCFARARYLMQVMWAELEDSVTWSEHFRPYFKRSRTKDGIVTIERNDAYIRHHGYGGDTLDELVVSAMVNDGHNKAVGFFDFTMKALAEDPSQANKFSAEAFDAMGDVSIVNEFASQTNSSFVQDLLKYALTLDKSGYDQPDFLSQTCFMNPANFVWETHGELQMQCGNAGVVMFVIGKAWREVMVSLSMMDAWEVGHSIRKTNPPMEMYAVDAMWLSADRVLWEAAKRFDRPDQPGGVAKELGLISPYDPNRPKFSEFIFRSLDPRNGKNEGKKIPVPARAPYKQTIPVAASTDSAAQSGHAFLSDKQNSFPKEKVKTRGQNGTTENAEMENSEDDDNKGPSSLADSLPTEFKMGKKCLKIFHRLLLNDMDSPEVDGQNKGQIRWGDFERAMRRIGFEVVQTAGSSVRFDPPAKTAHPITFHRPHPDSLLNPHMIKWIGARLNRCYGWTTASFERAPQSNE